MTLEAIEFLKSTVEGLKSEFKAQKRVLSFSEYLHEVHKKPEIHLRNAAMYFLDMINSYGSYEKKLPYGSFERYKLFDAPFDAGEGQLLGHERAQKAVVQLIENFVRAGKVDRLILLHGPNGSAKTTLVHVLTRAAEVYSHDDAGMLYRFNWIFPTKESGASSGLGFSSRSEADMESFAGLEGDQVQALIPCGHKDHPLLLLPAEYRENLFEKLGKRFEAQERELKIPDIMRLGDLSPKNKTIFRALFHFYQGDLESVLRHVQVERFFLSRRYRQGVVAVEPQMSVDAHVGQISTNQSLGMLPSALSFQSLFETRGALSDANRGIIEYSDLLKRPVESWKYLLVATEMGQASMDVLNLFMDMIFIGTSNELHLTSFREYPDWASFKGRFELVRVPYLLRYSDELRIYETQVPKALGGVHIAPHALEMAAKWATLTRLEPPKPESYGPEVRDLVLELTPFEKLELYDSGKVPERLSQVKAKELRRIIGNIFGESQTEDQYEGRFGASVREMKSLLLHAASDSRFDHLSPLAVIDGLRALVKERATYAFLRREPVRGFKDSEKLISVVEEDYFKSLSEEIQMATGLISADSHRELFERYVQHVSAWTKNEKLVDELTQKPVDPQERLMGEVEEVLVAKGEPKEAFRKALISQIGAYKLDNPESSVAYEVLFASNLRRLKDEYFGRKKEVITKIQTNFLAVMNGEEQAMDSKDKEQVEEFKKNLYSLGYNASSAKSALVMLMQRESIKK